MTLEITSLSALREALAGFRRAQETIALVPTMGALHVGHLALVAAAKQQANRVVVSIFVNPTQFGPNEDFTRYPRPLESDLKLLREAGAAIAWLPTVAEMYPEGFATNIHVTGVSEGLCGASRPGHFDGVATVVAKLLLQVMPDVALFGEKDYQQLCVIKRLVADLNLNTRILGVPTVREVDGLALSSRNQYLTAAERAIAPRLHMTLVELASAVAHLKPVIPGLSRDPAVPHKQRQNRSEGQIPAQGRDDRLEMLLQQAKNALLADGFTRVDYLELRAEETLAPLSAYQSPSRLLVAAFLGKTRLIDNVRL